MDPLIGRVLLERYEVLRKLGSGGMGAVYAGRQLAVGREVALKVLRSDLLSNEQVRERFRREAAIIGKLRHPNTIQLIDYGETDDGLAVMVTEILVGMGLSDRLRQRGPLSLRDTLQVGMEVASSLAEAHAMGLVHRDLKPANIFLVEVAGKVHAKVLDFGIARMLDEESTRITSTGQVFGTPRYMSPEQGTATGEVDHRADLYSLGLILFECLVGQPPFVAHTSIQYLSAHMTLPPPKLREHLPDAPAELDALIDRCLAKDPAKRVQSAEEVEKALRRIAVAVDSGQLADATQPPSRALAAPVPPTLVGAVTSQETVQPGARAGIPRALALGVLLVLLAGVATAGVVWVRGRGDTSPLNLEAVDASATIVVEEGPPDSGTVAVALAEVPGAPDAGAALAAAEPLDAGGGPDADPLADEPPRTDAGAERPSVLTKEGSGRTKKRPGKSGASSMIGGITGPRAMWIPTGEGDSGPGEAAKKCTSSRLPPGEAKLTLKPCRKGCAVIVDGVCAGKTPLQDLPVPDGNKNVAVICGSAVVVDQIARFRPGETTSLSCR